MLIIFLGKVKRLLFFNRHLFVVIAKHNVTLKRIISMIFLSKLSANCVKFWLKIRFQIFVIRHLYKLCVSFFFRSVRGVTAMYIIKFPLEIRYVTTVYNQIYGKIPCFDKTLRTSPLSLMKS